MKQSTKIDGRLKTVDKVRMKNRGSCLVAALIITIAIVLIVWAVIAEWECKTWCNKKDNSNLSPCDIIEGKCQGRNIRNNNWYERDIA